MIPGTTWLSSRGQVAIPEGSVKFTVDEIKCEKPVDTVMDRIAMLAIY